MLTLQFKLLTPLYLWNRFPTNQKPKFVRIVPRQWNFIYCDQRRWKKVTFMVN